MGPALAQLVEHLTVVVSCTFHKGTTKYIFIKVNEFGSTFYNEVKKGGYVVIKVSLVRIRQAGII